MMIPFCCELRGGDHVRLSDRVVTEILKFSGGPLGAETSIILDIYSSKTFHLPSCLVVTLVVAAGPPPTLV